jgi:hypothetical protein
LYANQFINQTTATLTTVIAGGAAAKGLVYTAGTVPNATVIGQGIANETVSLGLLIPLLHYAISINIANTPFPS